MEKYTLVVMRRVIIDVFILLLVFGIELWLRDVEPFQRGFFCDDPTIMYPYSTSTVSSEVLHCVGVLLPFFVIVTLETATLYRRKEDPPRFLGVGLPAWLRGCYCVLVAFGMGLLCIELATDLSKVTIGRLRPCFLDVCKPSIDCSLPSNQNRYILPEEFHCTATTRQGYFTDIRKSFMSGHSSWAAYTMVFLALYLHKRLTWRGVDLLRLCLQFLVVMISFFTALSRLSDHKHHPEDVIVGYLTGTLLAIIMWSCVTWVEHKEHNALSQHETAPPTAISTIHNNV